jgi:hypothetical protein
MEVLKPKFLYVISCKLHLAESFSKFYPASHHDWISKMFSFEIIECVLYLLKVEPEGTSLPKVAFTHLKLLLIDKF